MTHATPRPFDIDDDGFVNFDATGYSVEAYKIKPLLDTLDEAKAVLHGAGETIYAVYDGVEVSPTELQRTHDAIKAVLAKLEGK